MNKLYFQNLSEPRNVADYPSGEGSGLATDAHSNALAGAAGRLRAWLTEIDRKRRIEDENARAIAHLRGLTDEQLRDIGIARPDIERAVRLGRDAV